MPEWSEEEDADMLEASSNVGQEQTSIGEYESDAESVKDGKYALMFCGAKPWSSQDFVKTEKKPYQSIVLTWKVLEGDSKNMDIADFFTINPVEGKKATPRNIVNGRLAALGWTKAESRTNPGKVVYRGDFEASIGSTVYADIKTDDYGPKITKIYKGDANSDKLAEEFIP